MCLISNKKRHLIEINHLLLKLYDFLLEPPINTAIQYRRQGLFINDVITGAGTKTTKIPQRVATSFTNGEKKGKSIFPCSLSVLHRWHLHLSALYDEHHILSYDDHHIIIQLKRPKMCYIFDKQRVQGNQIWHSQKPCEPDNPGGPCWHGGPCGPLVEPSLLLSSLSKSLRFLYELFENKCSKKKRKTVMLHDF